MKVSDLVLQIKEKPRKLFLIDGMGALLSAFLLGVVLVNLEPIFGIPRSTLYVLAVIPCFFAAYDFFCYWKLDENLGRFLQIIAVLNVAYCCLSLGLAISHQEVITTFGWGYIIGEVMIVVTLAIFEWRIADE
ncbi:MAG: hypothetical protein HRU41_14390 [Saprospiraceae bacterium]|nr:hypothetical protein [Saprospiraceae bacterium]